MNSDTITQVTTFKSGDVVSRGYWNTYTDTITSNILSNQLFKQTNPLILRGLMQMTLFLRDTE